MSAHASPAGRGATPGRTPDWLLTGAPAMFPRGQVGTRRGESFVEKTLTGGADLMRQVMFNQDIAAGPGPLQRLDPRVKLGSLLVLLVATGLVHHLGVLVVVYTCTLVMARASRLPVGSYVKRVWLFVPVFTAVAVLPATLSIVIPGDVVVPLWSWNGTAHGLTAQGLASAALVIARVATSISLVVLLTLTTPWNRLLAALRSLGAPRMFILIIEMAYRYIFVLLGAVTDMYEARKARTVAANAHDRAARVFVSATAGSLFAKAHYLSEEVHQAMVARGYRGDAHDTIRTSRLTARDLTGCAVVLATALAIYGGDRLLGR